MHRGIPSLVRTLRYGEKVSTKVMISSQTVTEITDGFRPWSESAIYFNSSFHQSMAYTIDGCGPRPMRFDLNRIHGGNTEYENMRRIRVTGLGWPLGSSAGVIQQSGSDLQRVDGRTR